MWIIDRFEETIAVIETDDGMTEIPRSQILAMPERATFSGRIRTAAIRPTPPPHRHGGKSLPHGHGGSWENNGWNNR